MGWQVADRERYLYPGNAIGVAAAALPGGQPFRSHLKVVDKASVGNREVLSCEDNIAGGHAQFSENRRGFPIPAGGVASCRDAAGQVGADNAPASRELITYLQVHSELVVLVAKKKECH